MKNQPEAEMPQGWQRGEHLLYTLEEGDRYRGKKQFRNRLTVRVAGDYSSATPEEVAELTDRIYAFLSAPAAPVPLVAPQGGVPDAELASLAKEVRAALDVYARAHGIGPQFNRLISALLDHLSAAAPAAGASPVGGAPQYYAPEWQAELMQEGKEALIGRLRTAYILLDDYRAKARPAAPSLLGGGAAKKDVGQPGLLPLSWERFTVQQAYDCGYAGWDVSGQFTAVEHLYRRIHAAAAIGETSLQLKWAEWNAWREHAPEISEALSEDGFSVFQMRHTEGPVIQWDERILKAAITLPEPPAAAPTQVAIGGGASHE